MTIRKGKKASLPKLIKEHIQNSEYNTIKIQKDNTRCAKVKNLKYNVPIAQYDKDSVT